MDSARRPYTAPRPSANRIGSCSAYTFQCNPIYHSYSLHNNLQLTKHPIKTVHNYTYQNNNETQLNIFHHDTHNQIIYSMHLMPMSDGRFYRAILSADFVGRQKIGRFLYDARAIKSAEFIGYNFSSKILF